MKKHMKVNGKLLQMNKPFSQLKLMQQDKIINWMFDEYISIYNEKENVSEKIKDTVVLERVYKKAKEAGIWIPYNEVKKKYMSKKMRFKNRLQKQLQKGA